MGHRRFVLRFVATLLAWSPAGGCGDADSGDCPVGAERCSCTSGGACDDGLVCASGLCVRLGTDADADAPDEAETEAGVEAEVTPDVDVAVDADGEAEADTATVCEAAPGCSGAAVPGTIEVPLESLTPSAPPAECDPAKLRVRLASLTVHDAQDSMPSEDEAYCVVSARAPTGGEIRVVPMLDSLGNGDTGAWSVEAGVVWGQVDGPAAPGGTLELIVDCLESDSTDGRPDFVDRLAAAAATAGGAAFDDGWTFAAGIDVAALVSGTPWPSGDDHLMESALTIVEGVQLAATRGSWAAMRATGGGGLGGWDWEVRLEIWGCADNGTLPP